MLIKIFVYFSTKLQVHIDIKRKLLRINEWEIFLNANMWWSFLDSSSFTIYELSHNICSGCSALTTAKNRNVGNWKALKWKLWLRVKLSVSSCRCKHIMQIKPSNLTFSICIHSICSSLMCPECLFKDVWKRHFNWTQYVISYSFPVSCAMWCTCAHLNRDCLAYFCVFSTRTNIFIVCRSHTLHVAQPNAAVCLQSVSNNFSFPLCMNVCVFVCGSSRHYTSRAVIYSYPFFF